MQKSEFSLKISVFFILIWKIKGHDQVTEFLLSEPCKANIAIIDKQERRPIHWAALSGHNHVVKLLLAHSAELNCFDKGRSTPLHLAAANGYSQVVEQLSKWIIFLLEI